MERYFNVIGACNPQRHYMVNIQERLEEIKKAGRCGVLLYHQQGETVWKDDNAESAGVILEDRVYCYIAGLSKNRQ